MHLNGPLTSFTTCATFAGRVPHRVGTRRRAEPVRGLRSRLHDAEAQASLPRLRRYLLRCTMHAVANAGAPGWDWVVGGGRQVGRWAVGQLGSWASVGQVAQRALVATGHYHSDKNNTSRFSLCRCRTSERNRSEYAASVISTFQVTQTSTVIHRPTRASRHRTDVSPAGRSRTSYFLPRGIPERTRRKTGQQPLRLWPNRARAPQ